ncbi:hypothetical protein HK405_008606, partial [Cladochytrium tenue]
PDPKYPSTIASPLTKARWDRDQLALPKDRQRPRPQRPKPIRPASKSSAPSAGEPSERSHSHDEYNDAARQAYMAAAREECPVCGRGFSDATRLDVHRRSCKPGGYFARHASQRDRLPAPPPAASEGHEDFGETGDDDDGGEQALVRGRSRVLGTAPAGKSKATMQPRRRSLPSKTSLPGLPRGEEHTAVTGGRRQQSGATGSTARRPATAGSVRHHGGQEERVSPGLVLRPEQRKGHGNSAQGRERATGTDESFEALSIRGRSRRLPLAERERRDNGVSNTRNEWRPNHTSPQSSAPTSTESLTAQVRSGESEGSQTSSTSSLKGGHGWRSNRSELEAGRRGPRRCSECGFRDRGGGGRFCAGCGIPIVKKKLNGLVGFHNLPNQVHRKSIKKGFHFTIMIVGESGLGKSTLINTLFNTHLNRGKETKEAPPRDGPKAVEIQSHTSDIDENGVKLRLTAIETPGFGDFVNNEDSWKPILENIESRFDAYLEQENRVNRKKMADTRVHACLYFIAPTGHSLKPIDIEFMKRLADRVNLIPVIAKSDTLTEQEVKAFKSKILEDIATHKIQIYYPPTYDNDDPESVKENKDIIARIPFAVVGADKEVEFNGKKVRGRRYPWGIIEVDNEDHCDFVKLRQMLIRTHMEELKEYTNEVLYENYRSAKLHAGDGHQQSAAKFEEEKHAHEAKMAKMEAEMKAVFQQKVSEKESKLKQSEDELYARHREMKEQLERQYIELEEKKRRLLGQASAAPIVDKNKPKPRGFGFK